MAHFYRAAFAPSPTAARRHRRVCVLGGAARRVVTLWTHSKPRAHTRTPRPRLTSRAVERRTVHELLPAHHRAAAPAGFAVAAVGVQRPVEVPRLAVDVDIQRVERRPALRQ